MSTNPKNPPAFPRPASNSREGGYHFGYTGMTLHDWFAGQALAGMLANPSLVRWRDDIANQLRPALDISEQREVLAFKASQLADAMLAARQSKDSK